jgi:serine phosphatase RsbU (regulator of sigma subunit)
MAWLGGFAEVLRSETVHAFSIRWRLNGFQKGRFLVTTVAQVLILLAMAGLIDYLTGPAMTSAGLYLFPVALAGWKLGGRWGILTVIVAVLLNVLADIEAPNHPLPLTIQSLNELIHMGVYFVVCYFCVLLGQQQKSLRAERDQVQKLYRQMESEMEAAHAIQQLMAANVPQHPAIEVSTHLQAARILGGDCMDLTLGSGDRLAIAVGDVSGKGSPAALAGATLLGLLEDAPSRFSSPAETLSYLNQRVAGYLPEDMFITLFYALLDLKTGALTYASAGHEHPFLFRAPDSTLSLNAAGFPLGWFTHSEYEEQTLQLRADDLLFCYTDGLTDLRTRTGERLGEENLQALAGAYRSETPQQLLQGLLEQAVQTAQDIADDLSILVLRYQGPPRDSVFTFERRRELALNPHE